MPNNHFNFPEPPDFLADWKFSGDAPPTVEAEQVYIIDRDGEFTTKSKDELFIKYAPDASRDHWARAWSESVAVYFVTNLTKTSKGQTSVYTVAFYRSKNGGAILAGCDCAARVRCKHIVKAWLKHADAEKTGFLPKL